MDHPNNNTNFNHQLGISLTKEEVSEFQNIYKKTFDKEISHQQAYELGVKLLILMYYTYRQRSDQNNLQKTKNE